MSATLDIASNVIANECSPLWRLMDKLGVQESMTPAAILQQGVKLSAQTISKTTGRFSSSGANRTTTPNDSSAPYEYEYDNAYFYGAPFQSNTKSKAALGGGQVSLSHSTPLHCTPVNSGATKHGQGQWTESNLLGHDRLKNATFSQGLTAAHTKGMKICPFFAQGMCKYGNFCKYSHEVVVDDKIEGNSNLTVLSEVNQSTQPPISLDACCICFERPEDNFQRYGLLPMCNHVFCLECIRTWRKAYEFTPNGRDCPVCRQTAYFIIPSFNFVSNGPAKDFLMHCYHRSMKEIPCKLFSSTGTCKFGSSCFYKHIDKNGEEAIPEAIQVRVSAPGVQATKTVSLADFIKRR